MKHVLTGRADLARAYLSGGSELQMAVAGLLGFESLTPQVHRLEAASRFEVRGEASVIAHGEPGSAEPSINLPFWQANSFRVFESSVARLREELVGGDDRDGVLLEHRVLRPWNTPDSPLEWRLSRGFKDHGTRGEWRRLISIRSSSG